MNTPDLYCVVVTDPADVLGCLESPIIFHVKSISAAREEDRTKSELTSEDYGYDPEDVENLYMFAFKVTNLDILEEF
jgi:hypothetical protein